MAEAEAVSGAAVSEAMRGAFADWRRDGLLLCLLPVFCWPAVVAAVLTRPVALLVLLSPVVFGVRELLAARWAGRALRDPAARWTTYEAVVVRRGWLPPVLVLVLPSGERTGQRARVSPGLLGRRVLPPGLSRPAAGGRGPGDGVVRVLLAGDPAVGGVLWVPAVRRLGRARPAGAGWTGRAGRARRGGRFQPRSRVSR
ncbi:hypothetical protein ACTVZO_20365 [Streptomyces sp. IBSNAI002]|uniref:hypothetical protein n=1 Tax=Streptomyces sp. IBSNAI002 TaxID=3457500 RepID=UPI003FD103D3